MAKARSRIIVAGTRPGSNAAQRKHRKPLPHDDDFQPYIPARGLRLRYLRHALWDDIVDPTAPYLTYWPNSKDIELLERLKAEKKHGARRGHRTTTPER